MYQLKDLVDENPELAKEFAEVVNQIVMSVEERDNQ